MRHTLSTRHEELHIASYVPACGIGSIPQYIKDKSFGLSIALTVSSILNVCLMFLILSLRQEVHNCLHVLGVR